MVCNATARNIDEAIDEWCRRLHCYVSAEGRQDILNTSYDTYVGIVNLVLFSLYVFIINIMAAVNGTDSRVHAQLNGTLLSCGKVNTLNRCGEQHNTNMLQIFSATFLPNIVKFDQVISKSRKGALFYGSQCSNAYIRAQHSRV